MPVDDMRHRIPTRDDMELIPSLDVNISAEFVLIAERRAHPRFLALCGLTHLPPPRDNPPPRGLFVILTRIVIPPVEIELRAKHIPLRLSLERRRRPARRAARTIPRLRPAT